MKRFQKKPFEFVEIKSENYTDSFASGKISCEKNILSFYRKIVNKFSSSQSYNILLYVSYAYLYPLL